MKKLFAILLLSIFIGCQSSNSTQGDLTGSFVNENYIYGAAMNLAWNEFTNNILKEKVNLNTTDKFALEISNKFNNAPFTNVDLEEASYYVKSGYGQATIDQINKESKEKFSEKSFTNLDYKLEDDGIAIYAYFQKNVEYLQDFSQKNIKFNKKDFKGFYAKNSTEQDNIEVIKYWDDDKFIINLKSKQKDDELILAKGFDMKKPEKIVEEINLLKDTARLSLRTEDEFECPNINLSNEHNYDQLLNIFLKNKNFEKYFISVMHEKIKFKMDNKGASVENEAVILYKVGSAPEEDPAPPQPRKYFLNKPFWIIMKKAESKNPYLIIGINNEQFLTPIN